MECTAAGVEVPPNAEEVERMDAVDEARAAAEGVKEVIETESEEEEDPMSGDEGATSGDEPPAGEAGAAIPGDLTYEVAFHANVHNKHGHNMVQGWARSALWTLRDSSTAVRQLLGLKQGADPAETIQLVAKAKLTHEVILNRSAVNALAIVGTGAEDAQLKIARAAIAAASATQKKKQLRANALARVAKLEALETELTEQQKKSLALDKKKVETYSKELAGK